MGASFPNGAARERRRLKKEEAADRHSPTGPQADLFPINRR
jgi:hypothetical protein